MKYDMSRALESLSDRVTVKKGGNFCPTHNTELIRKGNKFLCLDCGYERAFHINHDFNTNDETMTTITMGDWSHCIYCCDSPDSKDHVIPYPMYSLRLTGGNKPGPKVICCKDCNCRLNDKYFGLFTTRCHEVQRSIRTKFHSVLKQQTWTESELMQLNHNLQTYIRSKNNLRIIIEKRLEWQESVKYVELRRKCINQIKEYCPSNQWLIRFMSVD